MFLALNRSKTKVKALCNLEPKLFSKKICVIWQLSFWRTLLTQRHGIKFTRESVYILKLPNCILCLAKTKKSYNIRFHIHARCISVPHICIVYGVITTRTPPGKEAGKLPRLREYCARRETIVLPLNEGEHVSDNFDTVSNIKKILCVHLRKSVFKNKKWTCILIFTFFSCRKLYLLSFQYNKALS